MQQAPTRRGRPTTWTPPTLRPLLPASHACVVPTHAPRPRRAPPSRSPCLPCQTAGGWIGVSGRQGWAARRHTGAGQQAGKAGRQAGRQGSVAAEPQPQPPPPPPTTTTTHTQPPPHPPTHTATHLRLLAGDPLMLALQPAAAIRTVRHALAQTIQPAEEGEWGGVDGGAAQRARRAGPQGKQREEARRA